MKALTLHQPWASLVAVGVKTVETRSCATSHRGPLLIHAAKRFRGRDQLRITFGQELCEAPMFRPLVAGGYTIAPEGVPTVYVPTLPRGAVVASCRLADVVPIVTAGDEGAIRRVEDFDGGSLWLSEPENEDTPGEEETHEITDQRQFGDFTPGRFAWLLEDVKPCDPVPMRGHQGLWNAA